MLEAIEFIELGVRRMLSQVSKSERATNVRLHRREQQLLIQIGELRNDLDDKKRGIDEKATRRKTR